jgi:hypothetical protein
VAARAAVAARDPFVDKVLNKRRAAENEREVSRCRTVDMADDVSLEFPARQLERVLTRLGAIEGKSTIGFPP